MNPTAVVAILFAALGIPTLVLVSWLVGRSAAGGRPYPLGPGLQAWQAGFDDHADAACALGEPVTLDEMHTLLGTSPLDDLTGGEVDHLFWMLAGSRGNRAFDRDTEHRARLEAW